MPHNTHFQILCAEAERFPQPPADPAAELDDVRAHAAELASNLTWAELQSSGFFAQASTAG